MLPEVTVDVVAPPIECGAVIDLESNANFLPFQTNREEMFRGVERLTSAQRAAGFAFDSE